MSTKAEALVNGLRRLTHAGELDRQSIIAIGPIIGIHRSIVPFYGGGENDAAYFKRIQESLRGEDGLGKIEKYFDTLNSNDRREIGRIINEVRIQYS